MQRTGGSFPGGHVPDVGSGLMNLPPSILNNPNIPPEVISNLQAGRLGSTIFVANVSKFQSKILMFRYSFQIVTVNQMNQLFTL